MKTFPSPFSVFSEILSDKNRFRKLIVDTVSAVLDGYDTAASAARDYRDRFPAVTAEREQKGIQFFIIGFDPPNDIFPSYIDFFQ